METDLIKQQAELIANLREENTFLHAHIAAAKIKDDEITRQVKELLQVAHDWQGIAAKWKGMCKEQGVIIDKYKEFMIQHFTDALQENKNIEPALRARVEDILKNLKTPN